MKEYSHYIATWFYKESADEASFYPQGGGRGDSPLLHSIYMQIQVPFFTTFRHYNPDCHLMFFTNLTKKDLPPFLLELFERTNTEIITLPYTSKPPKGLHDAWQNQFYVYDIFKYMEDRMRAEDILLVCDADCLCRYPLDNLFIEVARNGSSLYELGKSPKQMINGTTVQQMSEFYKDCYGYTPQVPIYYYGGEFIALRGDVISLINIEFPLLWEFNSNRKPGAARLHEEAHVLSVLAERIGFRNPSANNYVKRMWTNPDYNNVIPGDENIPVWHLPYEKKRGLYYLYLMLEKDKGIKNEKDFWKKASIYTGIPKKSIYKHYKDFMTRLNSLLKEK